MTTILGAMAVLNPSYDPDPAAGAQANRQWVGVTDGMIYGTIGGTTKWWHIDGAMGYNGSVWKLAAPAAAQPTVVMSDHSTCDPAGNAPLHMPRYDVRATCSGSEPEVHVAIYWYLNGSSTHTLKTMHTMPANGSDLVASIVYPSITDNDSVRVATTVWAPWLGVEPSTPAGPTSSTITVYLACGRPS